MPPVSKRPLSPQVGKDIYELLLKAVGKITTKQEAAPFLSDLFTESEKIMFAKRLSVAFLLIKGDVNYRSIAKTLKVSTSTISKINNTLQKHGNGFRNCAEKLMREAVFKEALYQIYTTLDPLPHKGSNWGEWKKGRLRKKKVSY